MSPVVSRAGDLVCLSHLRWDFVYQRPNHLMARFAKRRPVWFVEEPDFHEGAPEWRVEPREDGLRIVRTRLPHGLGEEGTIAAQRGLLDDWLRAHGVTPEVLWFYTPMALPWTKHVDAPVVVYDCMDELSLFHGAPPALRRNERELLARADVVFTGGQSLYEAKARQHPNVHAFPSSVDREHFAAARGGAAAREGGARGPRIGYFGVIDERLDTELLAAAARMRPDWQFVMVGPVVKIDPAALPREPNIEYVGGRPYAELPEHIRGWDVAIMPFARNDATRFISPTKTLEYLAAGKPVVSTSIRDVVRPYGEEGVVRIADEPFAFVAAIQAALEDNPAEHLRAADAILGRTSWDNTYERMVTQIERVLDRVPAPRGETLSALTATAT